MSYAQRRTLRKALTVWLDLVDADLAGKRPDIEAVRAAHARAAAAWAKAPDPEGVYRGLLAERAQGGMPARP